MTRPSDRGASGVDWSGELEAVDGISGTARKVFDHFLRADGLHHVDWQGYAGTFHEDGRPVADWPWRIRNRQPQPQPQPADTVTVGRISVLEAMALFKRFTGRDVVPLEMFRELGILEDDPIEPDLIEARKIAQDLTDKQRADFEAKRGYATSAVSIVYTSGEADDHAVVQAALAAIKRGRALATAEKALAWGEGE